MKWQILIILLAMSTTTTLAVLNASSGEVTSQRQEVAASISFPSEAATPSEKCGVCHRTIYREFATGFGSDLEYRRIIYRSSQGKAITLPESVSSTATLHAVAGQDPFPIHARNVEEKGRSCNVCHFPQAFEVVDMENPVIAKPATRPRGKEKGGLTCATCHLTPDGKIRGPYDVDAPT